MTNNRSQASQYVSLNPPLGVIMNSSPASEGFESPAPGCCEDPMPSKMKVEENERRESDEASEAGNSSCDDTNLG